MVLWLNGALVATVSAYERYLRERPEDHEDGWADRIGIQSYGNSRR